MNVEENEFISCPYCWQRIEISIDCSVDDYSYVEDCHVCCRPIHIQVRINEDKMPEVQVRTDND